MVKKIKQINWVYLAGFLDGDGSIYVRIKPNNTYRYGFQIAPSVVFFQSAKEKQKIEKLQKIYKIGYLRDRKDGITEWVIGDEKSIRLIIENTRNFLHLKQKQAQLMLEVLDRKKLIKTEKEFIKLAKNVDRFRELNYSKKRKKLLAP